MKGTTPCPNPSTTSDAGTCGDGPLTAAAVREELLRELSGENPEKREKQIVVNDKRRADDGSLELPVVAANTRTVPGIITQRGCCYAGCKGVILGPTRDIVNITHGPIGCGFYSWLTRRNQTHTPTDEHDNFMTYCFSTDMRKRTSSSAARSG
jgi:nitrogenase molybdenum-iron protein alpha chain